MSRNKSIRYILIAALGLLLTIVLVGCTGPAGPAGPEGPQGPPGPPGASGEAVDEEAGEEVPPVEVDAGDAQTAEPGESVSLKATVKVNDGSAIQSYSWQQISGVNASLSSTGSESLKVTLDDSEAYRDRLVEILNPVDRFTVLGIDPHALEVAEETTFKVTVETSSGTYSDTVTVMAHLPYEVSLGINNVPIGLPVLVNGKNQDSYNWTLSSPDGSSAELDGQLSQNPLLTPDVTGQYTLTEANSAATIDIYAGTWIGAISGQDNNGQPLSENCTVCHNGTVANMGTIATDNFTPWKQSGHAEIFSVNLNTSTHYSESCLPCHTVGYNTDVDNNGIDDAVDWEEFIASDMLHDAQPTNWATTLAEYPQTASRANIQCENCHGPNTGNALHSNGIIDEARVSIAAEVCGSCHGEPARHGRYQQWEESNHANYELAIERGTNTSCARCHAGQGFLAWLPQLEAGNSGNITADITWTADTVEPVTCAVCHDSHNVGNVSGEPNNVNLRVNDNTPMLPAGFQATAVGNGALCMTCHNTRNGAHNDNDGRVLDDRAPHVAAQADVLMGENAYFVEVGSRAAHSYIENSCTNCHMVLTPPPAEFSYNLSGTNHSFEPSMEICSECHGAFDGVSLTKAIEAKLEELKEAIEEAIIEEITAQTDAGNVFVLVGFGANGGDVKITDGNTIEHINLIESHGRQAIDITIDGQEYEHIRLVSDTRLVRSSGEKLEENILSSAQGQNIAKAGWNYFLIHGDGSHGIHNPDFTLEVLNASISAVK